MKIRTYKNKKDYYLYKLLSWSVILGSFYGYYLLMNKFMNISIEICLSIILPTIFIMSSGIIALSQIEYNKNFSNGKIYSFDKKLQKLNHIIIIILQLFLIVVLVLGIGYSVLSFMVEKNISIGLCFAFMGIIAFMLLVPTWRYIIHKRIK